MGTEIFRLRAPRRRGADGAQAARGALYRTRRLYLGANSADAGFPNGFITPDATDSSRKKGMYLPIIDIPLRGMEAGRPTSTMGSARRTPGPLKYLPRTDYIGMGADAIPRHRHSPPTHTPNPPTRAICRDPIPSATKRWRILSSVWFFFTASTNEWR